MKIFSVIIITFCFNISFACKCKTNETFDIWSYLDYTTVVKGEIISIENHPDSSLINNVYMKSGGYQLIELKIEKVYKGEDVPNIIWFESILPNHKYYDCGTKFNKGDKWYIFTNPLDKNYYINNCFWSQKVGENSLLINKTLKYIKSLASIKNGVIFQKYCDRDCLKKRKATGEIINGQAEGFWQFLDKKGNPIITGNYSKGERQGLWLDYYRDEHELALNVVSAKSYHSPSGSVSISYNQKGEYIYGYRYKEIEIPKDFFTHEEIEYLKTKEIITINH